MRRKEGREEWRGVKGGKKKVKERGRVMGKEVERRRGNAREKWEREGGRKREWKNRVRDMVKREKRMGGYRK